MKQILKVVTCGEVQQVTSQKAENGLISKRQIVLQEIGNKYEDQYVAYMFGSLAECKFYPGDVVAASLRFIAREHTPMESLQSKIYQDVVVTDIIKLEKR